MKKSDVTRGDITGGASQRRCSEWIAPPPRELEPAYRTIDDYDPVLRSHCRLDFERHPKSPDTPADPEPPLP